MFVRSLPFVVVPSLFVLAAGCGDGGGAPTESVGQSSDAVTVCPAGGTLEGVDVSEFQGSINWGAVKGSGRAFAIARVSDGTGHPDPTFATNWAGIKNAGMVRGVYQFFRASEDPVAQANLLLSAVGALGSDDLRPVADVEVMDGVSGTTLVNNLAAWITRVRQATGLAPMIYTAPGFWDALPDTGQFGNDVLWVANWQVNCPDTPTPWTSWSFWQYADNGSVPGISGAVDVDRFNGTLAQLQQQGGGADWAAQWVGQSFPLAATPLALVEGQTVNGYIELKNTGRKAWTDQTRLGTTQARDRASVFADKSWLSPSRAAEVTGTVAPGASYKFQFNLRAPNKPGTYLEYFGVVDEGVAWFGDPTQGGPPDNQLEVQIVVTAPEYRGDFSSQSFPLAPAPLTAHAGDVVDGFIELTNSGTRPWTAGTTKLAPTPRDKASAFADPSWLSPTRAATLARDVAPGSTGRFAFKLRAAAVGDFEATFGLVQEGVTWFADAPLGGGPADDLVRVHFVVVPSGASLDAGAPPEGGGGIARGGSVAGGDDGGGNVANSDTSSTGSSSGCSMTRSTDATPLGFGPLALVGALLMRRRARARRG